MTRDEFLKRFPNATEATIRRNVESATEDSGNRPCAELQEQKDAQPRKAHHRPKKAKVDEAGHSKHGVAIAFIVSDNRERDGDGGEATLLDCLVSARKRLLSLPDAVLMEVYRTAKR